MSVSLVVIRLELAEHSPVPAGFGFSAAGESAASPPPPWPAPGPRGASFQSLSPGKGLRFRRKPKSGWDPSPPTILGQSLPRCHLWEVFAGPSFLVPSHWDFVYIWRVALSNLGESLVVRIDFL